MVPILLIAVNVFIYLAFTLQFFPQTWLEAWMLKPYDIVSVRCYSVVLAGFVHADLLHLGMNMLGVWVFGNIVEERLGFWKTVYVYFGAQIISMVCASVIYMMLERSVAIVGASGAVMGLLAASMLLNPFKVTYEMIIPIPVMFKGWLFLTADVIGFLEAEQDGVSHTAHLMGFLSIVLLMYFLSHDDRKKMHSGFIINLLSLAVFFYIKMRWMGGL
jgi:membrane associated rhomboid family serine protease